MGKQLVLPKERRSFEVTTYNGGFGSMKEYIVLAINFAEAEEKVLQNNPDAKITWMKRGPNALD